jgi:nitronate monooxygenase
MESWPDRRIQDLIGIEVPIIQAPMAGAMDWKLVVAVAQAGALGSLPCALLTPDQVRAQLETIRQQVSRPINLNFFCHPHPDADEKREVAWRRQLEPYYRERGLDPAAPLRPVSRMPFDSAMCDVLEQIRPEVVSFHFGLPEAPLLARVKATGAHVLSCATTVEEARWLEDRGCDAIIAQGFEAGGHRGMFLDLNVTTQVGTLALVPQVVDAVKVPVIAAGGIADGRGVAAAMALGAAAVQIGTAYLFCPEAKVGPVYRKALRNVKDNQTVLTNVFSGRPARGIVNRIVRELGPISDLAPAFPLASVAIAPLRTSSEAEGSEDFAQLWSGQAAAMCREIPAGELTRVLASEALSTLGRLNNRG